MQRELVLRGDRMDEPDPVLLRHRSLAKLKGTYADTLPLLVKGVLTGEDAVRARDCGVDGIVVSNHGGRQVDGAVAALVEDAPASIRRAVVPALEAAAAHAGPAMESERRP